MSPKQMTIKRLFAVSSNRCAMPGCTNSLIHTATGTVVGEVCHIKAESRGGPRFDPALSILERNDFDNLVTLCPICHKVIDSEQNIDAFPVDRLQQIKREHEARAFTVPELSDTSANDVMSQMALQEAMRAKLDELIDDPIFGKVWCCPNCGAPASDFQHRGYSDDEHDRQYGETICPACDKRWGGEV